MRPLLALLLLLVTAGAGTVRVACVGDSITEGSGYPGELQKLLGPGYEVKNFGVSSTTLLSKGEKPWLDEKKAVEAFAFLPGMVVVMLGTNDTKPRNYRHVAEMESDLSALVQRFAALPGPPRVWLATPCPVYYDGNWGIDNSRLNEGVIPAIRRTAAALKVPMIDLNSAMSGRTDLFYKDHVHPLGGGQTIAATVYEALTGRPSPVPRVPPPPAPLRLALLSGEAGPLQAALGNRYEVRAFRLPDEVEALRDFHAVARLMTNDPAEARRLAPLPAGRGNLLENAQVESGTKGWLTRGGTLTAVAEPVHGGRGALRVTGRTSAWHGPGQDVAAALRQTGPGWYRIAGSVRLGEGAKPAPARIQVILPSGYLGSQSRTVSAETWTDFDDMAYLTWIGELKSAVLYVETNNATADVLVDDFALELLPP